MRLDLNLGMNHEARSKDEVMNFDLPVAADCKPSLMRIIFTNISQKSFLLKSTNLP